MLGMRRGTCVDESWVHRNLVNPLTFDARRGGRWREPYAFWQFVEFAVYRRSPREWWIRWRLDVAARRRPGLAEIMDMPEGPERDAALSTVVLTLHATAENLREASRRAGVR